MFRRACAQELGGSGGKQFNFVPSKIFVPPTLIPKITAGRGKIQMFAHELCDTSGSFQVGSSKMRVLSKKVSIQTV